MDKTIIISPHDHSTYYGNPPQYESESSSDDFPIPSDGHNIIRIPISEYDVDEDIPTGMSDNERHILGALRESFRRHVALFLAEVSGNRG